MLSINIHSDDAMRRLQGIQHRLANTRLFFRNVVRPKLLDEFAAAYREAGYTTQSGRLLESYISLTHAEHVSEISDDRIVQGTRVPYAVFVERLLPIAGRVARNQTLFNEFAAQLGDHIVDGHTG